MPRPRLADVDLNLLVAVDALLAERSVTRAAKRLGVGQPAMSATLARLRTLFGDPLLVRTPQGMALSARGDELREPIRDLLGRIEATLGASTPFDARAADRAFVLCTTDYLEISLAPGLLARMRAEAPNVRLEVRSLGEKRVGQDLAAGAVDVAVGHFKDAEAGLYRQVLFHERLVCLVHAEHPRAGATLDIEQFAALDHVVVSPRGGLRTHVDTTLAERGLTRRIVHRTPHFLVAAMLAAQSDLVATVAERLARGVASLLPVRIVELPVELAPMALAQLWHERTHHDLGHRWFRRILGEVASET